MAHRPSQTLREAFLLSRIGLGDKVVTKLYGTYLPADLLLFYTVFSTKQVLLCSKEPLLSQTRVTLMLVGLLAQSR